MGKYLWRGALLGFLITLVLGGVLFAFGPEAVDWDFTPVKGEVSIIKGIVIPATPTALMGMTIGIWLGVILYRGRYAFVKGFLIGAGLFPFVAFASVITLPFFSTAIISLVHLPGVFLSDVLIYPFLKYLRGENFLIVQSQEPLLAWTDITVSWLVWGFVGGVIGHLRRKETERR